MLFNIIINEINNEIIGKNDVNVLVKHPVMIVADEFHNFINIFKKHMGLSPKQYQLAH